jgi:hypothetical protein
MRQCEAVTQPSTYAAPHRCLKRHGLIRVGEQTLCAHHRQVAGFRGPDDAARGR